MTAAPADYRIVVDNDEHGQRIIAVTADTGVEIAGAYRPGRLNDWRVFVTKLVSAETGLPQPHKVHACSREDAARWVDTIAYLYMRAVPQSTAVAL